MSDQPILTAPAFEILGPDGKPAYRYLPSEKGRIFHAATTPNFLAYGNRGGGKSTLLRNDAHIRAMLMPGFSYIMLRKTFPELENSHLMHLPAEMHKLGGYYHSTKKIAYYPNGNTGTYSQCDSEEDVLKLLSRQYAAGYWDELSTFDWEVFLRVRPSIRVTKESGLIAIHRAATNPYGPSAPEIQRYFIDRDLTQEEDPAYNKDSWGAIQINLADCPYVDVEQYKSSFAGLKGSLYKAWVLGEFSQENSLFNVQPTKKVMIDGIEKEIEWHYINDIDMKAILKAAQVYRAIDLGWNPDPTYCLWIAHLGNRFICLHEKKWNETIVPDIASDIKEIDAELASKVSEDFQLRICNTFCDPSMDIRTPADIRSIKGQFESYPNNIPMETSINNRVLFAQVVHTVLGEEAQPNVPRIQIYKPGCPYLCKTLPQQQFDPKEPLKLANHKHDHPTVTLAYALMSNDFSVRRTLPAEAKAKKWLQPKEGKKWVLGHDGVRDHY